MIAADKELVFFLWGFSSYNFHDKADNDWQWALKSWSVKQQISTFQSQWTLVVVSWHGFGSGFCPEEMSWWCLLMSFRIVLRKSALQTQDPLSLLFGFGSDNSCIIIEMKEMIMFYRHLMINILAQFNIIYKGIITY